MNRLPLSMRMLRRNWSAGELRVLLLALLIAVASVTTVGFFADRVQGALDAQANELLGGDLVLIADKPIPEPFFEGARARRLTVAQTRTFPSMVAAPAGGVNLAEIKAISDAFPLRGRVRIAEPAALEAQIDHWPGVVSVGLFARQPAAVVLVATALGVQRLA